MGTINLSARWTGEALDYIGIDTKGNEIKMGKQAISPSQMMLLGLAGCTGMDVVSILQKKRQNITGVQIELIAHQPDSYPKPFEVVEMKFTVTGEDVDPEAVARAIELSENKYCVVGQTLQHEVEIKTSYEVVE